MENPKFDRFPELMETSGLPRGVEKVTSEAVHSGRIPQVPPRVGTEPSSLSWGGESYLGNMESSWESTRGLLDGYRSVIGLGNRIVFWKEHRMSRILQGAS